MANPKSYAIIPKVRSAPDYARVVRACSDHELRSDLANDRGDDGFRKEALAELKRRAERRRVEREEEAS